jgi:His-Xaa-Ser system radical SAM maturase HxsB
MLNYYNFRNVGNQYLITNDLGRYLFLSEEEFLEFSNEKVEINSPLYKTLEEHYFISNEDKYIYANRVGEHLRNYKQYLFQPTALHIFVVTKQCNQQCVYCQASTSLESNTKMSRDTAKAAVDIALSVPTDHLTFEFQGGEPLLNFEIIKYIVEYTNEIKGHKKVNFSLISNLIALTDEMIDFIRDNKISMCTSLDGNAVVQNTNRPILNGDSHKIISDRIESLRNNNISLSAIQTTTRLSMNYGKEIVDEYIKFGFHNIFIRPLTPLGFADENWKQIGYKPADFITFYKMVLEYILDKNMEGIRISEGHASIFLRKIIQHDSQNYMELRSPCGGAIGQMAYYYNGEIYSCDEARMLSEMGNKSFLLGNVKNSKYSDLIQGSVCKSLCVASYLEGLPLCSDCVYQSYCGTCPVVNLYTYGTIFPQMKSDYRCEIYKGILDTIFNILKGGNKEYIEVFNSWL